MQKHCTTNYCLIFKLFFMKTYSFITVILFSLFFTSCTTEDIDSNNNETQQINSTTVDGFDSNGEPVKTNGKDD